MAKIEKASDVMMLLKLMLRELELPNTSSHIAFVEAMQKLQREAKACEEEMRKVYEDQIRSGNVQKAEENHTNGMTT